MREPSLSPYPKCSKTKRQAPMGLITDDAPPSDFYNIMAQVFLWILLAGFLILPSSFPNIQTIVKGSGTLTKVVNDVRNTPAYVPSFPLVPLRPTKKGFSGSIFIFKLTRRILSTG
jgi:hypothetical protein